ncbi:MAG: extracellular solute-binding protein [Clostridia bacterium]|nr:extracellular solute-binding protein [Clostridia bacterium]
MKKLALFLALVMIACTCLTGALAEEDILITWWGNQTRNERTHNALMLFASEHEGVTFTEVPNSWADYWKKVAADAQGDTLDVIQMDYQYLNQYAGSGLLLDLTPYVESGALNISGINDGIINAGKVDGKLYAVCIGVNAPALLYNKTVLDAAGIAVKDNMTLDEFLDLCREIYEKTGYKTNIGYGTDMVFGYILRGYGINLFENGKLNITKEDAEKFLSLYETGIKEGWLLGSEVFAETAVGTVEQDPMVYGSDPAYMSWCAFFWSNQVTAMQNAAPEGVEIGLTTWPSPDPVKSNYLKPSQFFSVAAKTKHADTAVAVVDFWTNSVEANKILLGERGIPAAAATADGIAELLDASNQKVVAYINNVVSPNCSNVPAADPAGASEFYNLVDELQEAICYGAMSASDAAAQLIAECPANLK